jgi:hypothetical protein
MTAYKHKLLTHARTMSVYVFMYTYACNSAKTTSARTSTSSCNAHTQTYSTYVHAGVRLCPRTAFDTSVGRRKVGTELNKASGTIKVKARIPVCAQQPSGTQGKCDEAEPLYQRSLAIRRKVCAIHLAASSRDHSCKVLGSCGNFAQHPAGGTGEVRPLSAISSNDRKVSALMPVCLFHRTSCQVYGDEHSEVATNLNNLVLKASPTKRVCMAGRHWLS